MNIPVLVPCPRCDSRGIEFGCKECGVSLPTEALAEALFDHTDNMPCGDYWKYLYIHTCYDCNGTGKHERIASIEDLAKELGCTTKHLKRSLIASAKEKYGE